MNNWRKSMIIIALIGVIMISGFESIPARATDESILTVSLNNGSDQAVSAVVLAKDEAGTVTRLESVIQDRTIRLDLPIGVYELSVITLNDQSTVLETGKLANIDLGASLTVEMDVESLNLKVISEVPEQILVGEKITVTYEVTDHVGFLSSGTSMIALGTSKSTATIVSTVGSAVTLSATITVLSESSTSLTLTSTNAAWNGARSPSIVNAITLDPLNPSSPTLSTTNLSYNAVSLSWGALPLVERYEVWRSEGSLAFTKIMETSDTKFTDVALKYQVAYRYKVVAIYTINESTLSKESNVISVTTALEVPMLTVINTNHTTNSISWSTINGASGYELVAAKGTGAFALISSQTGTSFSHTKLTLNTSYSYKVRAYRLVGKTKTFGAYTEVTKTLTLPAVTPSVTATSAGVSKLNVSWTAVSGASGYEVYVSTVADKGYVLYATVTKNTVALTGLTINVPLYIKIRTYILSGKTKIYSKTDSSVITGTPIPLTPVLTTSSVSYNTVKLSWGTVDSASGYAVERLNPNDSTYTVIAETASGQTSVNVSDLITGKSYTFRIRAFTDAMSGRVYSDYSLSVVGIPKLSTPTGLTVVSSQYNQLLIAWTAVEGAEGYYLYRSSNSKLTGEMLIYSGNQTEFTDTGLVTNTIVYYRLMAVINGESSMIFSGYSAVVSAKPVPAATTVTATSVDHTSTQITWDLVDGASGYDVYGATSVNGSYKLIKSTTGNSFLHTKLTLGATTYYKVIAYRTVGKTKVVGAASSPVSVRSVPEPIKDLNGTSLTASSVSISWTAVKGAGGYRVFIDSNESGAFVNVGGKVTTTSYTITGLTINKPVAVKVYAVMMSGKTEVIGTVSKTIYVTPVPQAPTVSAKGLDHKTVELSWLPITDVDGYAIYSWDSTSGSYLWLKDVVLTTETIQDLPAGQPQKFVVLAYKVLNGTRVDGTVSAEASVTPRLQAPIYSSFGAANFETISFTFAEVRSATGYRIYRGLSANSLSLYESWDSEVLCYAGSCLYIDIGVLTGTPTFYQIQACVIESDVEYCGDVSETRSATTVLEAPLEPWTFKNSTTSIVINYGLTDGAEGYEFYYSTSSGGKYTLFYTMIGSNGLEHTGLKSNTSYYYKMRAFRNVNGKKVYSAYTLVFSGRTAKTLKVSAALTYIGNTLVGIKVSNNSADTLRIMRYGYYNDYYYDYDDSLIDLRLSYYDLWGGYYTDLTFYYTYTPLYVLSADNFMLNVIYDEISYYLFLYVDGRVVLYEDENFYYND